MADEPDFSDDSDLDFDEYEDDDDLDQIKDEASRVKAKIGINYLFIYLFFLISFVSFCLVLIHFHVLVANCLLNYLLYLFLYR